MDINGKTILAVGAHPDDLDFGCAGTMAKWIKEGAVGYYLIITDGSKGSEDMLISHKELVEIRHREQKEAAEALGIKQVFFLDFVDGELENTVEVRREIVRIIRQVKPDVVISWDPTYVYNAESGFINHPDHRNAGQATLDAVFPFARNSRTFPELLEEGLKIHKVSEILLFSRNNPNFLVDITNTLEKKLEALSKHASQQDDFDMVQDWVASRARKQGELLGVEYAEGFTKISLEG